MNLLGLHLQFLIGKTLPTPAPVKLSEALESVEVTHKDHDRSGFQLVFQVGRSELGLADYELLKEPRIKPFNRVLLNVFFGLEAVPIMDGIITNHQLVAGNEPGTSKLTIIGEDVSLMMDLEKKAQAYPNLADHLIVPLVLMAYTIPFGVVADVEKPANPQVRTMNEQTTTQSRDETDLSYLQKLAGRYGFGFYVEAGPAPFVNTARWGSQRRGIPQSALSVDMGHSTNVESISFRYDELTPKGVTFTRSDGGEETVEGLSRTFGALPLATRVPTARQRDFLTDRPDGLSDAEARARAQGEVNKSSEKAVTATGTLDALRYGRILKPRGLVGVRGAGEHHDGTFYVKTVTHKIDVRKGEYKQAFSLTREGVGTTTPLVRT